MAIASLVSRGVGVSLLPDWAPMWLPSLSIARISLPGTPPTRSIGVLYSSRGPRQKLVDTLLKHARQALRGDFCSQALAEQTAGIKKTQGRTTDGETDSELLQLKAGLEGLLDKVSSPKIFPLRRGLSRYHTRPPR